MSTLRFSITPHTHTSNYCGDLPGISHWCKLPTAVFHQDVIDSVDGAAIDLSLGDWLDVRPWKDGRWNGKWLS